MSGALRIRLALERPEIVDGAVVFADAGGVWADVSASDARTRFDIRLRRDVRAGWRVTWGARRYRIVATFDADDRGARLALVCEEELP